MRIHLLVCAITIGEDDRGRGWLATLVDAARAQLGVGRRSMRPQIEVVATGSLPGLKLARPGIRNPFAREPQRARNML